MLLELTRRRLRRGRLLGSSRISSSGIGSSACASSTRRSSPPDNTESGARSRPAQPDRSSKSGDRAAASPRVTPKQTGRRWRVSARKSATVTGRRGIDREALRHVADAAVRPSSARRSAPRTASGRGSPRAAWSCRRRSDRRSRGACPGRRSDDTFASSSSRAGGAERDSADLERDERRLVAPVSSFGDQRADHRVDVRLHLALELVGGERTRRDVADDVDLHAGFVAAAPSAAAAETSLR